MTTLVDKDACELLDADHIAVKHLFVAYARLAFGSDSGSSADKLSLARKICSELTLHARIEEEIFYRALREVIDEPRLLDQAQAEHQAAKGLIAQIEGLAMADAKMDGLVAELNRVVEQHVREERDDLFPKARTSGLDLDALGDQLRERQQALTAGGKPARGSRAR